jgi:RNA polymerase sigma-70 factor (ECF subfamily)
VEPTSRGPSAGAARERPGFGEEALPHLDAVYRFALGLTRAPDEAEDLVQETFLRALRSWDQYTPGTRAKSWLFTICRNLFLRGRERAKRHEEILATSAPRAGAAAGAEIANPLWSVVGETDPEGGFFEQVVDARIVEAIEALPDDYRTAVVLSDVEGLSYGEIAELTEVPVGTVKSRLFRGRRRLQELLYDHAVAMGYIPSAAEQGSAG